MASQFADMWVEAHMALSLTVHLKTTHGRQVYETLCTAVADCRKKENGGCVGWVMKRLDIGAQAMGSGIGRR